MIGGSFSHYEILAPLGEGGMGQVYRARDTKLDRDVAVKMLPERLAADPTLIARFNREAKLLAALNHPNIATIHAIEEVGAQRFLVLELVDGETLAECLRRGPLPLDEALDVLRQVARALEAAHERGIIHRDLKPANVMVTPKKEVKILDFGIARGQSSAAPVADADEAPTSVAAGGTITEAGTLLGTGPYMSPEQVRGDEIDERSDIWSFGCLGYESLTGKRAFDRDTLADTLSAILEHQPDWDALPPDTPDTVRTLLGRCLQKQPDRRLHHVADARLEIEDTLDTMPGVRTGGFTRPARAGRPWRWWPVAAALAAAVALVFAYPWFQDGRDTESVDLPSIVVMPAVGVGETVEQTRFAAGIGDELATKLAAATSGVVPYSVAMSYDRTDKTLGQIGQHFDVDYVLELSMRWAPEPADTFRLTSRLLRVADGFQLWSGDQDGQLGSMDFFDQQGEVATRVLELLAITLPVGREQMVETWPTDNMQAWDAYRRGVEQMRRSIYQAGWRQAIPSFREALELDPNYAAAEAMLARALSRGSIDDKLEAREIAERLHETRPELPQVHWALGEVYYEDTRSLDRSTEDFDPRDVDLTRYYRLALDEYREAQAGLPYAIDLEYAISIILRRLGDWDQSVAITERAHRLLPEREDLTGDLAISYLLLGRVEDANRLYDRWLELAPGNLRIYPMKVINYLNWGGMTQQARSELKQVERQGACPIVLSWLLVEMADDNYQEAIDRRRAAEATCEGGASSIGRSIYPFDLYVGLAHRALGQEEQATAAFERVRERMEELVRASPMYDVRNVVLGLTYALLGREQEARRYGELGVALRPPEQDHFQGREPVLYYARLLAQLGDLEGAVEQLRRLDVDPMIPRVNGYFADPFFDPLTSDPEYRRQIEEIGAQAASR